MKQDKCRICDSQFDKNYIFKEMMFGMRDEFQYAECVNCGSIQILEVPQDIEKYYPPYYYSFNQEIPTLKRKSFFKRMFKNIRMKRKYRRFNGDYRVEYLKPVGLMPGSKILDIGCGKGALICTLFNIGFEQVSGVDKYIPEEKHYGHGVKILKKDLSELPANSYDLLIMHHVLEHIDEEIKELKECYRLLRKNGVMIISIPVVNTAWEIYKNNWVQLDPPRHFVLHTIKSINILAEKTGFKIEKTIFDSTEFQFLGSELYKKGIPLTDPDTHLSTSYEDNFSPAEILKFRTEAKQFNLDQKGDSARFYLRKI